MKKHIHQLFQMIVLAGLVTASLTTPARPARAANLDPTADRVFGQPDFSHNDSNHGGLGASSLALPDAVALDAQGNLYVADSGNNRVLEYDTPLTTDFVADRVFGQPDFSTNDANHGGLSASSLNAPDGVAVDAAGNLYVADFYNNRVLEYDTPLTSGTRADRVFGQPDFSTNDANHGGLSGSTLYQPSLLTLDAGGNLYVDDYGNNRVLEYDAPLRTNTIADRVFGQLDFLTNDANHGGLSASSLYEPDGVAVDAQGNLYVGDLANNRALEYDTPLTTDTTADHVFGQPDFTHADANHGGLSASSLYAPAGVALDAQGNLYVVDHGNHRALEYDAPLSTDTVADRVFGQPDFSTNDANHGGLSANSLDNPLALTIGPADNLFVADCFNNRVLEYDLPTPNGVPTLTALSPETLAAGSGDFTLTVNGTGFVAGSVVRWDGSDRPTTYLSPTQLNAAISAGDLTTGGPFAVTVFTPAPGGGASTLINLPLYPRSGLDTAADRELGQPGFQEENSNNSLLPGGANRLYNPRRVAIDPVSGRLFVADRINNRVLSWPDAAAFVNGQAADLVFGQPNFSSGSSNEGGLSARSLYFPAGVAVDGQGNLYVADTDNNRVLEYDAPLTLDQAANRVFGQGGNFTTGVINNGGVSANSLANPTAVAVDAQDNLYVTDQYNHRVLEFITPLTTDTSADLAIGQPDFAHNDSNHGGLSASSLNYPYDLALDTHGNLYVADAENNRVLEYDAPLATGAAATHLFGQPDYTSNDANHGGLNASSLNHPGGLAVDSHGNLFVADTENNRLLEYKKPLVTDAVADRVFGQPDFISNDYDYDGISANSLYFPYGLTVDMNGNLYLADSVNSRILEYDVSMWQVFAPVVRK